MGIVCAGDRGNMMGNGVARLFAPRKAPSAPAGANPCLIGTPTPRRGCRGASGKPPACSDRQQLCRKQIPLVGIDAPTPARIGTGRPKGRSHFSFDGERKVCKRKPAARRLREKALYCPFLKEGVRNVARSMVELPTSAFVRARAHSFPLSKRARLFPSAAYRRSASRRWRLADTKGDAWDIPVLRGWFRCIHKQTCFSIHSWR